MTETTAPVIPQDFLGINPAEINKKLVSWGISLDEVLQKLASLGLPGIIFIIAVAASSSTTYPMIYALLGLGGPLGVIGGLGVLGISTIIGDMVTGYGIEAVLKAVYLQRRETETQEYLQTKMREKYRIPTITFTLQNLISDLGAIINKEQLFEAGLIKVVFATATLSAGINMPARTTVISALSKRTDDGHSMLTPSEFVQIAGRAGRRGMDAVGHVVTVQTPFEGAKEAAFLAIAQPEPLQSCFAPSYGMVLNLLQKHSLEEAKDLLERSFAEYLARLKLSPERQQITALTTELAKLDMELAGIEREQVFSYEKLRERLREEERLYKILASQSEAQKRQEIHLKLPNIPVGTILHLKGKHIKVPVPVPAIFVNTLHGAGQVRTLVCLGSDNRWYLAAYADISEIDRGFLTPAELGELIPPSLEAVSLGGWRKGEENTQAIADLIPQQVQGIPPVAELATQAQKIEIVNSQIAAHPLQKRKNPGRLMKLYYDREIARDKLHKTQIKYQKQQSRKSYYWEEFLNLIEILREFQALEGYLPTPLGEAAATIRGENELWLGLAMMSGDLDRLTPSQLAAAISAMITEPPRPDTWCNYPPVPEVIDILRQGEGNSPGLREVRRLLYQAQSRYDITIPVWLETQLMGIASRWAQGTSWPELCENTSLDEGDLVRLLRRTVDVLWQIPQIPRVSQVLKDNARLAVTAMKRFPL